MKFLENLEFQLKFNNNNKNDDDGKDNEDDNNRDDQDNRQTDRRAIPEHLLEFLKR